MSIIIPYINLKNWGVAMANNGIPWLMKPQPCLVSSLLLTVSMAYYRDLKLDTSISRHAELCMGYIFHRAERISNQRKVLDDCRPMCTSFTRDTIRTSLQATFMHPISSL